MLRLVTCDGSGASRSCGGLVAAPPGVVDRIVLSTRRIVGGQPLRVELLVTNETDRPIQLREQVLCRPAFTVALTNRTFYPNVGIAGGCLGSGLVLQPGTTRFRYEVPTTYSMCSENPADARSGAPACTGPRRTGIPPLPPGAYVAVLLGDGSTPLPPAVSATITILKS